MPKMPSSSGQPKQFKGALQQPQSSPGPLDANDQASVVYFQLRTLGLPDSVTFEGFLSVYTLGLGRFERRTGGKDDNIQLNVGEKYADVKERTYCHTKPSVRSKSHLLVAQETNYGGENGKGKWKDTLDMVAQRLVGRSEAARVRAFILAATSKGEVHLEDPMKVANDRSEILYRVLGSTQKEWEFENRNLMDLDRRKKELESEIECKRKVILLLNVLEKREGFRMKRIGCVGNEEERSDESNVGIGDLIKRLRTEAILNSQVFRVQKHPEWDTILSTSSLQKLQRRPNLSHNHSTIALANLHSYHLRLVHMKTRTSTAPNGSAELDVNKRIENALKTLGIKDIQNTKRKLEEVARLRAERRRKFDVGSVTDLSVNEVHLEELQRANERKKQEVQQELNRAIGFGWVCEGYVDLISTFREQTVPALEHSMEVEGKRIEEYMDKMKMAILGQRRKANRSFSQRAREIMGTTKVKVWEEVDEVLKYSSKVDIMVLGPEKDLVVDEMDLSDISRLLERKNQKAEVGCAMVEDIRGILQGYKKLKYI